MKINKLSPKYFVLYYLNHPFLFFLSMMISFTILKNKLICFCTKLYLLINKLKYFIIIH